MNILLTRARDWYARFERPISSLSLIGGFVFDAITLKRVDLFWENFWVIAHLVIVATCIALINLGENEKVDTRDPSRAHFWYVNILQFFFGGLLSTFLVFYFRSTTLAVTWPFLLVLAIAFIANESLKKHYARLTFQMSLFYLSLLSFAVFIVPVLFHRIGTDVFLISVVISVIALGLFIAILGFFAKEKFKKSGRALAFSIIGILIVTNILYFSNLIPPIPLSLADGGIYHSLYRDASGNYVVQSEHTSWLKYFSLSQDIHLAPGEAVYAYSAIFSPTSFNTDIIHQWQRYDAYAKEWVTQGEIVLSVAGGREGGYRTYSFEQKPTPGEWRVNIETVKGQIISRLRFTVIAVDSKPTLTTNIKE